MVNKIELYNDQKINKQYPLHEVISIHKGRSTFITSSKKMGVPDSVIMKFTHKSIVSFARYDATTAMDYGNSLELAQAKAVKQAKLLNRQRQVKIMLS